ncbi:MAG: family 2 glycosyl transferase [Clostridiales bacterium]|jgi:glycosyltransferase involved in cell wall biosynthesis|nr:family 2 glycosyl transferase [Clostridiales bacterium]
MQFSVLVSVYPKVVPSYLEHALISIVRQSLMPDEIVLVKDGPLTDGLEGVIQSMEERYPGLFRIVALERHSGLGEALKIGILNCTYPIVARMDADDISLPQRFEKQLKLMENNPEIDLVGSWLAEFETDSHEVSVIRQVPIDLEEIKSIARYRNPLNHCTVVYRKSSVISSGNYKDIRGFEDYYLWIRMLRNNCKMVNIPEVLVLSRADNEMYLRRGGLKYIGNEMWLLKEFYKLGFISLAQFVRGLIMRSVVRLIPNYLRAILYKKILRKRAEDKEKSLSEELKACLNNSYEVG